MGDSQRNSSVSIAKNASPLPSPLPPSPSSSSAVEPIRKNLKVRRMTRQMSMSEVPRDIAWERRRQQGQMRKSCSSSGAGNSEGDVLTDEDLKELKGCIDLGFGFNEQNGQRLCTTIPALDLYFAVNRVFASSPMSSPSCSIASAPGSSPGGLTACVDGRPSSASMHGRSSSASLHGRSSSASMHGRSSSFGSFVNDSDSWKICNPGDDPQHVKTKLRHWAQAVACSVKQSS